MVRQAEPGGPPPPRPVEHTLLKKLSAVFSIILLYSAATPFSPVVWVTTAVEGSFLLDRLCAGAILFGALYFQWRISAVTSPIVIFIPTGQGTIIRDGNITRHNNGIAWLYDPIDYWKYLGLEVLVLLYAELGENEIHRRIAVCCILAPLWAIGWFATPSSTKIHAWEQLKQIWFWIALDEIVRGGARGLGFGGARNRRRYYYWKKKRVNNELLANKNTIVDQQNCLCG